MVSRAASTARLDEKLSPAEVALLEVLRDWGGLVETSDDEAARIIATHLTNGTIRTREVARAAKTEPPSVRARLRSLLAKLGYSKDANVIKAPRPWGKVVNA